MSRRDNCFLVLSMESNGVIRTQYNQLVVRLNKGNKLENESTKAEFWIEKDDFLKLFLGLTKDQKSFLCFKQKDRWQESEVTGYDELEKFLVNHMWSQNIQSPTFSQDIKSAIFKLAE